MNTDEPFRARVMAAAWFYDGEGSTTVSHGIARVAVVQAGDPYVLERFRQVFGVGKVYGPYPPRTPRQQIRYHYLASRFEHVQAVIAMMWQFLSPIKRRQAALALKGDRTFRAIKRGNHPQPACKNGHAMTLENSRFTVIPEGKRRRCLECSRVYLRNYMRRARAQGRYPRRSSAAGA